mgnify:CR=1 FL=1
MDRVIGYFRDQFERNVRDRTSRWFHTQTDRLFRHFHQHSNGSLPATIVDNNNNSVASTNASTVPYERLPTTSSDPEESSGDSGSIYRGRRRGGNNQRPRPLPYQRERGRTTSGGQTRPTTTVPTIRDHSHPLNNASFGWSPFFQTPPWSSPNSSFQDPLGPSPSLSSSPHHVVDGVTNDVAQMMTWPPRHL